MECETDRTENPKQMQCKFSCSKGNQAKGDSHFLLSQSHSEDVQCCRQGDVRSIKTENILTLHPDFSSCVKHSDPDNIGSDVSHGGDFENSHTDKDVCQCSLKTPDYKYRNALPYDNLNICEEEIPGDPEESELGGECRASTPVSSAVEEIFTSEEVNQHQSQCKSMECSAGHGKDKEHQTVNGESNSFVPSENSSQRSEEVRESMQMTGEPKGLASSNLTDASNSNGEQRCENNNHLGMQQPTQTTQCSHLDTCNQDQRLHEHTEDTANSMASQDSITKDVTCHTDIQPMKSNGFEKKVCGIIADTRGKEGGAVTSDNPNSDSVVDTREGSEDNNTEIRSSGGNGDVNSSLNVLHEHSGVEICYSKSTSELKYSSTDAKEVVQSEATAAGNINKMINDGFSWFQSYFKLDEGDGGTTDNERSSEVDMKLEEKTLTSSPKASSSSGSDEIHFLEHIERNDDAKCPSPQSVFADHHYLESDGINTSRTIDTNLSGGKALEEENVLNVQDTFNEKNEHYIHNTGAKDNIHNLHSDEISASDRQTANCTNDSETQAETSNKPESSLTESSVRDTSNTCDKCEDDNPESSKEDVGRMWNGGYHWLQSYLGSSGDTKDTQAVKPKRVHAEMKDMHTLEGEVNHATKGTENRNNNDKEMPDSSNVFAEPEFTKASDDTEKLKGTTDASESMTEESASEEFGFSHDDLLIAMKYLRQNISQLKELFPQEIENYQSCTMELTEKREKFEEYHSKTVNQLKMHLEEVDEINYDNNKAKVVNSTMGAGAGSVVLASAFVPVLWPVALGSFAVTAATAITGYMQEKDTKKWEEESMDKLKALHEGFQNEVSDVSQNVKKIQECVFEILLLFEEKIFCGFEDCLILRTCEGVQQLGTQDGVLLDNDLADGEIRKSQCEYSLMSSSEMVDTELFKADEMCETDHAQCSADQIKVCEHTGAGNAERKCSERLEDEDCHVHCLEEPSEESTVKQIVTVNTLVDTGKTEDTEVKDTVQGSTTVCTPEDTDSKLKGISEAGQAVKETYENLRASVNETVGPLGVITMDNVSTVMTAEVAEAGKKVARKLYTNAGAISTKAWCKLRNQVTTDASNVGGKLYLGGSAVKATATQGRVGSSVFRSGGMAAESFGGEGGSMFICGASKKGELVAAHAVGKKGSLVAHHVPVKPGSAAHAVGKKGSLLAAHAVGRHGGTLAAKTVGRLGHFALFAGAGLAIWTVGMDVSTAVSAALEIAEDRKHGLHHAIYIVIETMECERKKLEKLFDECEKVIEDEIFYQFCKESFNN